MTYDHILLWIDLETTGLDTDACDILEFGWGITTLDPSEVVAAPVSFYPDCDKDEEALYVGTDDFVRQMHNESRLWMARQGAHKNGLLRSRNSITRMVLNDCRGAINQGGAVTVAGSGVSTFDMRLLKRDYPALFDFVTYYTMDISVIERYLSMRSGSMRGSSKSAAHRVVPDIMHSWHVAKVINAHIPIETCTNITEALHASPS